MIKSYHDLIARWARRMLICSIVLCTIVIAIAAFAATGDHSFDEIRQQASITSSYNFSPLPANAGKGITVAIISQGISQGIKSRLGSRLSAYSVLPGTSSPFEDDDPTIGSSIGTQMASLVGALAPYARIITVKAMDSNGSGSYADIRNGITRATELGAKIIVLPISARNDDAGVAGAINVALKRGVLVVASAANSNSYGAEFPARMDGVVAVGATDVQEKVAPFSNYGGKIIFAPGVKITVAGRSDEQSGTSHAATVAGAIFAVLWSQNPGMSRQRLVDVVTGSAKAITARDGGSARLIDGQAALKAFKRPGKGK
ncbi:MAG: hypothetical protein A2Z19_06825 [Deltaproteobacteria bacterium RBG_16_54_18]|nr:MAG: hypothetical protein A2Z19_06825 [Deltaproteobacteria bacterium RBG_16_54_18]